MSWYLGSLYPGLYGIQGTLYLPPKPTRPPCDVDFPVDPEAPGMQCDVRFPIDPQHQQLPFDPCSSATTYKGGS